MLEDSRPPEFGGDCRALLMPLIRNIRWMKWLGGILIGIGVLYCAMIVGLIFGWLPIWIGLLAYQSARRLEEVEESNDEESAVDAITRLGTYFKVSGIAALVTVAIYAFLAIYSIGRMFAASG